ncbi:unnamed protein product, partial [Musa acuminata subsp. burmannicoides]
PLLLFLRRLHPPIEQRCRLTSICYCSTYLCFSEIEAQTWYEALKIDSRIVLFRSYGKFGGCCRMDEIHECIHGANCNSHAFHGIHGGLREPISSKVGNQNLLQF